MKAKKKQNKKDEIKYAWVWKNVRNLNVSSNELWNFENSIEISLNILNTDDCTWKPENEQKIN